MYKHILVPTDGSPLSLKAARAAGKLAAQLGAKVTSIYVIEPYMPPMSSEGVMYNAAYTLKTYDKGMRKVADKANAKIASAVNGVPCASIAPTNARPWEAIVEAAKSRKCDLIVMASHGRRGLAGLLLGSETQKVLTHSKVPVLVCR
jgi:nucleotide-binding universal stress UspA family protein